MRLWKIARIDPVPIPVNHPMKTRTKIIAAGCIIFVLAGVVIAEFISFSKTPSRLTVSVLRMDLEESVQAAGSIRPVDQVNVGAQVNGQVVSIKVAIGERVKKGQLLVEIDPSLQIYALQKAKANLASVRAQLAGKAATLKNYKATLARQKMLYKANAGAETDLEQAQTNVDTTRSDIKVLKTQIVQAKIDVETAQANVSYTKITAPIEGEIMFIVAQLGQTVVSAQSVPTILVMGNLDRMTVKAQISEADIVRVQKNQEAYFTVFGAPGRRFSGKLRAIETVPESAIGDRSSAQVATAIYYNGVFEVANPDRVLKPFMTAQVRIVQKMAHQALVVPLSALRENPGQKEAYRVDVLSPAGKRISRPVEIGIKNDVYVQIVKGLQQGENVLLDEDRALPNATLNSAKNAEAEIGA